MNARVVVPAVAIALAFPFASSPADACMPPLCVGGQFLPAEGAVVPANAPAIWWWPDRSYGTGDLALPIDDASYHLTLIDQGQETTLAAHLDPGPSFGGFFLVPKDPMPAGKTLRVRGASFCPNATGQLDDTASTVLFQTTPSSPLPTTLGTLSVTASVVEPLQLADGSGSCASTVTAATARVSLVLSAEALPWKDVLAFETYVDGQPWGASHFLPKEPTIGSSWEGRAADLVFALCEVPPGAAPSVEPLDEGAHEVVMRAWVPGDTTVVETVAMAFALSCQALDAGAPDAESDAHADATVDGEAETGADAQQEGATDAVSDTTVETGSAADSGMEGGPAGAPGEGTDDGCSCSTVGGTARSGGYAGVWVGLVLLALGMCAKRRGSRGN